jgi:hypothetical protein
MFNIKREDNKVLYEHGWVRNEGGEFEGCGIEYE